MKGECHLSMIWSAQRWCVGLTGIIYDHLGHVILNWVTKKHQKTLVYQIPKNEVNHDTVKLIADDSYNVVHVAQKHKLLRKASSTPLDHTHANIVQISHVCKHFGQFYIYNLWFRLNVIVGNLRITIRCHVQISRCRLRWDLAPGDFFQPSDKSWQRSKVCVPWPTNSAPAEKKTKMRSKNTHLVSVLKP